MAAKRGRNPGQPCWVSLDSLCPVGLARCRGNLESQAGLSWAGFPKSWPAWPCCSWGAQLRSLGPLEKSLALFALDLVCSNVQQQRWLQPTSHRSCRILGSLRIQPGLTSPWSCFPVRELLGAHLEGEQRACAQVML